MPLARRLAVLLIAGGCLLAGATADGPKAAAPDFDRTVAPLLVQHCLDCHSGPKPKGGLDLSRKQAALAGGKTGVVLVPGKPDESRLWEHVDTDRMPPKKPLAAADKAILKAWVAAGANWGTDPIDPFRATTTKRAGYDWWSLQPVVRPPLPAVRNAGWARNPIDRFVLHQLEAKGLSPAEEATRRTLVRRVTFDLIGLPPTPEEMATALSDGSPEWYEKVVDRLLASPHYGVRWARHWLDVVRFGESNGFEHDEFRPSAWPYRDWVVTALNRDLPYDEFARLQLAGDVLRPEDGDALAATGFLVAGAYDSVGQKQQSEAMRNVVRQDELEDITGTVGQTFLGLTVHCARCHDHKFDPVRQTEYYRLTAALGGVRHGERNLPGPEAELAERRQLSGVSKVYAVTPKPPEVAHLLVRGDPKQRGEVVSAGGVASLVGVKADFGLPPDAADIERRKRLADWITDPKNPLFARVMVNRIWHHHFGIGLVDTPNDFGFNGGRPSHPALLDWLASELVVGASGGVDPRRSWSLKHLHCLIVTSATYRQSSRSGEAARIDVDNRLLWRKSPLRLEAETVRDAMLAVSGQLNPKMGGPGFQEYRITKAPGTVTNTYTPVEPIGDEFNRRTLYRTWARGGRSGLLDALDCPDPSTTTPRRAVTTTPLQALVMLNNALVLQLADRFAERLVREAPGNVDRQVRLAYLLAFARPPSDRELTLARDVVRKHGLAVLTRAIFNSNEFLYVD